MRIGIAQSLVNGHQSAAEAVCAPGVAESAVWIEAGCSAPR